MKKAFWLLICLYLMLSVGTVKADSYDVSLYRPDTAIASAPIVWQTADAAHTDLSGDDRRPSALVAAVALDEQGTLSVYDGATSLGTLDAICAANGTKANLGVRVADLATAQALAVYVEEKALSNLWLIAADPELINTVRAVDPLVRGVVDITAGIPNEKTLYDLVYGNQVRSLLIDAADATPAKIRRLQECDYMVYVDGTAVTDATGAYNLVVSGCNGILTADSKLLLDTIESFVDYTLTRGSIIVGHRGEYTFPNNSMPAFLLAAESGAAAVELDTWLSRDGYVVLSHDNDMADSEQVAQGGVNRKLTASRYVGQIDQLTYAGTPYPYITLDQLFEATVDRYPNLLYRVELKDYSVKNVNAIIEIIERFDVRERCQLICFEPAVTTLARKKGYAVLYLDSPGNFTGATDLPDAARKLEKVYRPFNSWYSSTWSNIDANVMEYMQHFGLAVQPWPTSAENDAHGHLIEGYNGFTTDYCHWTNDYVKYIEAHFDDQGKLTVTGHLYDGNTKDMSAWAEMVPLTDGAMAVRVRITLPTTYQQNWYYMYSAAVTQ